LPGEDGPGILTDGFHGVAVEEVDPEGLGALSFELFPVGLRAAKSDDLMIALEEPVYNPAAKDSGGTAQEDLHR
jgi:hypothetical protein